jgi:hypothetical protein
MAKKEKLRFDSCREFIDALKRKNLCLPTDATDSGAENDVWFFRD